MTDPKSSLSPDELALITKVQISLDRIGSDMREAYVQGPKTYKQRLCMIGFVAIARAFYEDEPETKASEEELRDFLDEVIAANPGFGVHSTDRYVKAMEDLAKHARMLKNMDPVGVLEAATILSQTSLSHSSARAKVLTMIHRGLQWLANHEGCALAEAQHLPDQIPTDLAPVEELERQAEMLADPPRYGRDVSPGDPGELDALLDEVGIRPETDPALEALVEELEETPYPGHSQKWDGTTGEPRGFSIGGHGTKPSEPDMDAPLGGGRG